MTLNVNNHEADTLTRRFAQMAGVSITDAIVIAMKEAIAQRREAETPLETAERIRQKYGLSLNDETRKPLPKQVFDEIWGDDLACDD